MGIVLGLAAAAGWGLSDFLARFATRRIGTFRTLLFMQVAGLAALTIFVYASGGWARWAPRDSGWHPWAWAALAGALNAASSLALYRSFELGVLAVVAPIGASYPALTVLLSLLTGERLRAARGLGIMAVLAGVVLASIPFKDSNTAKTSEPSSLADSGGGAVSSGDPDRRPAHLLRGVGWAMAAAAGFGVLFWVLGFRVSPVMNGIASVWMIRVTTLSLLLLVAAPARQTVRLPDGKSAWMIAGMGVLDTGAFVANNFALRLEQVAVASVLASLYGVVTVVLAGIFLRESLQRWQWVGVAAIFAGIALINR